MKRIFSFLFFILLSSAAFGTVTPTPIPYEPNNDTTSITDINLTNQGSVMVSFIATSSRTVSAITIYAKKVGNPRALLQAVLYTDNRSGAPNCS